MTGYVVTAAYVTVRCGGVEDPMLQSLRPGQSTAIREVPRGGLLPATALPESVEHLLSLGLVAEVPG